MDSIFFFFKSLSSKCLSTKLVFFFLSLKLNLRNHFHGNRCEIIGQDYDFSIKQFVMFGLG